MFNAAPGGANPPRPIAAAAGGGHPPPTNAAAAGAGHPPPTNAAAPGGVDPPRLQKANCGGGGGWVPFEKDLKAGYGTYLRRFHLATYGVFGLLWLLL